MQTSPSLAKPLCAALATKIWAGDLPAGRTVPACFGSLDVEPSGTGFARKETGRNSVLTFSSQVNT